jgi:DNA-binding GntR family transcriptional regulator
MKFRRIKKADPILPKVVDMLRNAIVEGTLEPGERLNETSIASKLGISRSPVREAIKVLESENLVETFTQRGSFVKGLSVKEVEDLYMVLNLINRPAIRVAAEKMNAKKENDLKALIDQISKSYEADDIGKNRLLARRFHRFIIEATENDLLLKIYDSLRVQEERFRYYTLKEGLGVLAEAHSEHLAIVEALLERDPNRAESLITNHFDRARLRVLNSIQKSIEGNGPA